LEDDISKRRRLREIAEKLKREDVDILEVTEELADLAGPKLATLPALARAQAAVDGFFEERVILSEVEAEVRACADRFPAMPIFFLYCWMMSRQRDEESLESIGYLALYRLKAMAIADNSDFRILPKFEEAARSLFEFLDENPVLATPWPYLDEECADHLVDHILLQNIAEGAYDPKGELAALVKERRERMGQLLANMLEDLLRLKDLTGCPLPPGVDNIIALLGVFRPPEALPALLKAAEACVMETLQETVIALAKMGSLYPEVAEELRKAAGDAEAGELRLAAIDALALMGESPENRDFLLRSMARLDPSDELFDDLFMFLTHAMLSVGSPEMEEAVRKALEEFGDHLDPYAVRFTRDYLEHYRENPLHVSLGDLLREEVEDFLDRPMSDLRRVERRTLTMMREELLAKEEEEEAFPDPEVIEELLRMGRNQPCFCGSGLKFKKCCLPRLEEIRRSSDAEGEGPPLRKRFERLLGEMSRFASVPSLERERRTALREFLMTTARRSFEDDRTMRSYQEVVFETWFYLARPLGGGHETLGRKFRDAWGAMTDPSLLSLLDALLDSRFSVYEVQEVVPEKEVLLLDLFRRRKVRVSERTGTRQLVKWDLLATRVGKEGGKYRMLGYVFRVDREFQEPLLSHVEETCRRMVEEGQVGDLEQFLQRHEYMVLHHLLELIKAREERVPVLVTPEGDRFVLCSAVYEVSQPEEVARILNSHPYMEETTEADEGSTPGTEGSRVFQWHMSREMEDELRAGEHIGFQNPMRAPDRSPKGMTPEEWEALEGEDVILRSFGQVELKGERLTFRTQSKERLERGKKEIERLLGGLASHRADSFQDLESSLREGRLPGFGASYGEGKTPDHVVEKPPPEHVRQAMEGFLERLYAGWLDQPLPYLDDLTPREAAKTPEGREKLQRLLKDYENRAEKDRQQGKPVFDFSRFRRELDLWPE